MAEIINLRRVRKAKTRAADEKQATQNRVEFGRSKLEKAIAKAGVAREARQLDGHKIEIDGADVAKRDDG